MKTSVTNKLILIAALCIGLTACTGNSDLTGGAEAGNPAFRDVTGEVSSDSLAKTFAFFRTALASSGCPADEVMAIGVDGVSEIAEVKSDCSFVLTLEVNKSYSINFLDNDAFVATLIFQASETQETTDFTLSEGETAVDMGIISISGIFATPSDNPYEQNDQDDDGENDYEDSDDDNDGIDDSEDYVDCDGDGFVDDEDHCEAEEEDSEDN